MIAELRSELKETEDEIAEATRVDAGLAGGLVKALVAARLEVLRTTSAVLRQRIMVEETGAPLTIQIPVTTPDPILATTLEREIETQLNVLKEARSEAARFVGGLVHALKLSTVATHEQSLSMLRQRYLMAKYGLCVPITRVVEPNPNASPSAPSKPIDTPRRVAPAAVLKVRLLKKQFTKQNHQEFIFFDAEFAAMGLKRASRAIKGQLKLNDLFGETKMVVGWMFDGPLQVGETFVQKGKGFLYNQFMQPHQWVNTTALENMSATFDVDSILYQDGSREDFS